MLFLKKKKTLKKKKLTTWYLLRLQKNRKLINSPVFCFKQTKKEPKKKHKLKLRKYKKILWKKKKVIKWLKNKRRLFKSKKSLKGVTVKKQNLNHPHYFYILKRVKNKKYIYKDVKLEWLFQKFSNQLMNSGKKEKLEKKLFTFYKVKLKKKKQYNFSKFFLAFFFEKLKKCRPLIELSKKSKNLGKKSAKALERHQRRKYNRLIVPNFMSKKKTI